MDYAAEGAGEGKMDGGEREKGEVVVLREGGDDWLSLFSTSGLSLKVPRGVVGTGGYSVGIIK